MKIRFLRDKESEKEGESMKNSNNKTKNKRIRLEDIKVTVHIPDKVSESVRREKINLIYDILSEKSA